jgi:uncharacterized protein YndB with AHSA1/START domain
MITVKTSVNAPVEKAWEYWTTPAHIMKWNAASDDWHTTKSENDLRKGGSFSSRMEAKDGSFGFDFGGSFVFDFGGIYDEVKPHEHISFTMGDGRKVKVDFRSNGDQTEVIDLLILNRRTQKKCSATAGRRSWIILRSM